MSKKKVATKAKKGLGDAVETVAKPIAKAIDKIAGTDLEHCPSCERRKSFLNSLSERFCELWGGKPYREPSDDQMGVIAAYFERGNDSVNDYWQKRILPIYNYVFYTNQGLTSCPPCWRKVESKLRPLYDVWKEESKV